MAMNDTCQVGQNCSTEKQPPVNTSQWGVLCGKHRYQMRRNGKIIKTSYEPREAKVVGDEIRIPLGLGAKHGYVIVDKDFEYLAKLKWTVDSNGYAQVSGGSKNYVHRLVTNAKQGEVVDHIDGNKLNCKSSNLRLCTQAENARNQKLRLNNTSGYKGVRQIDNGKFIARIKKDYKYRHLGVFKTKIEAAIAYNEAAQKLHGEFARLNDVR